MTAAGELSAREIVLLRIHTDDDLVGLGEGVPLSLRGDLPLEEVEGWVNDAATRIVGLDLTAAAEDPMAFAVSTAVELTSPRRMPSAAAATVECAVFDLAAKLSDQPLWRLLGASDAAPVACNATLTSNRPEAVAEQALSWADRGFSTFKLKLGARGEDPRATVAAVREALGSEPRIRVDANQAWTAREAARALNEIADHEIELAEQPVAGLRALAGLARETTVPLCADEAVASVADAHRAVRKRACTYSTAKLSKVGGLGAARQIAAVLPTYLSSALDGPIGIAAAAHVAQAVRADGNDPGVPHGLATQLLFDTAIASVGCELQGDQLVLPQGIGLGVELDEDAVAACRV